MRKHTYCFKRLIDLFRSLRYIKRIYNVALFVGNMGDLQLLNRKFGNGILHLPRKGERFRLRRGFHTVLKRKSTRHSRMDSVAKMFEREQTYTQAGTVTASPSAWTPQKPKNDEGKLEAKTYTAFDMSGSPLGVEHSPGLRRYDGRCWRPGRPQCLRRGRSISE